MTGLGIRKYFDFVLASVDTKCAKPDPRYKTSVYAHLIKFQFLEFLRWL